MISLPPHFPFDLGSLPQTPPAQFQRGFCWKHFLHLINPAHFLCPALPGPHASVPVGFLGLPTSAWSAHTHHSFSWLMSQFGIYQFPESNSRFTDQQPWWTVKEPCEDALGVASPYPPGPQTHFGGWFQSWETTHQFLIAPFRWNEAQMVFIY